MEIRHYVDDCAGAPVRLVTSHPASGVSHIQIVPSTTVTTAKSIQQRPATVAVQRGTAPGVTLKQKPATITVQQPKPTAGFTIQQRPAPTGVAIQQKPVTSQRLILPATQVNSSPQVRSPAVHVYVILHVLL